MDLLTKLYRIRKTCLEMLHDRGYLVSQARKLLVLDHCFPVTASKRQFYSRTSAR